MKKRIGAQFLKPKRHKGDKSVEAAELKAQMVTQPDGDECDMTMIPFKVSFPYSRNEF